MVLHFSISTQPANFGSILKLLINANSIKWSNKLKQFANELFECEIVLAISNRRTKTSELLLMEYIKIAKLFMTESHIRYVQILKFQSYITAQIHKNNQQYTKNKI